MSFYGLPYYGAVFCGPAPGVGDAAPYGGEADMPYSRAAPGQKLDANNSLLCK